MKAFIYFIRVYIVITALLPLLAIRKSLFFNSEMTLPGIRKWLEAYTCFRKTITLLLFVAFIVCLSVYIWSRHILIALSGLFLHIVLLIVVGLFSLIIFYTICITHLKNELNRE